MVALVGSNINPKTRPPLVPSDAVAPSPCRPKAREVTSRYMPSAASTERERKRVATPRWSSNLDFKIGNGGAQKMLITSARSLSVSFQGESFSLQVSKVKQAPLAPQTPSWRNLKSVGRLRQPIAMSRKMGGSGNVLRISVIEVVHESNSAVGSTVASDSVGCGRRAPRGRGIVVPARFLRETNNRVKRHPESKNNGFKSPRPIDSCSCSCTRGQSSPIRGPIHSFSRGKIGENRIGDAHQLRLLYNRVSQWRFVNARAQSSLSIHKLNAEKSLYTAWVSTSKLRESVRAKRIELQLLRQNLKVTSILKGQMPYLEDWGLIDHNYSTSLLGAMEALRASTLRLPLVDGARADIQQVQDAISSAVDVMQAMASSICLLLPKVDEVQSLVYELASISAKECGSLNQCKDLLSMVASMQVKDCSLKTHILQQKCPPSA